MQNYNFSGNATNKTQNKCIHLHNSCLTMMSPPRLYILHYPRIIVRRTKCLQSVSVTLRIDIVSSLVSLSPYPIELHYISYLLTRKFRLRSVMCFYLCQFNLFAFKTIYYFFFQYFPYLYIWVDGIYKLLIELVITIGHFLSKDNTVYIYVEIVGLSEKSNFILILPKNRFM